MNSPWKWRVAALALALCCALVWPLVARSVKNLDVNVDLPVYEFPTGIPLHDEEVHYRLRWSGIPVAHATIAMRPNEDTGALDFSVEAETNRAIAWLYRFEVVGRGVVRTAPFGPSRLEMNTCENKKPDLTRITFPENPSSDEPIRGVRQRPGRSEQVYQFQSDNTHDLASATYLLLNLDYEPGAHYEVDTFTGKSRYLLSVDVAGREKLKIDDAKVDAWRLTMRTRELTDDDDEERHRKTSVWVTPERPRRLLRARSETYIGALTLEMESKGETSAKRVRPCA